MLSTLRQRVAAREESGFTLIELLVVLIIIGILLAIAVPSYLGFRDRAQKSAAMANVRAAIPDAEAYFQDNPVKAETYNSMDFAALQAIDGGVKLDDPANGGLTNGVVTYGTPDTNEYCLESTVGKYTAWVIGPAGSSGPQTPTNGVQVAAAGEQCP